MKQSDREAMSKLYLEYNFTNTPPNDEFDDESDNQSQQMVLFTKVIDKFENLQELIHSDPNVYGVLSDEEHDWITHHISAITEILSNASGRE